MEVKKNYDDDDDDDDNDDDESLLACKIISFVSLPSQNGR